MINETLDKAMFIYILIGQNYNCQTSKLILGIHSRFKH
jgi:hypothetical protein